MATVVRPEPKDAAEQHRGFVPAMVILGSEAARDPAKLAGDLKLLIIGPAAPPACINHLRPLDLGNALITVHKHSSQYRSSLRKLLLGAGIRTGRDSTGEKPAA